MERIRELLGKHHKPDRQEYEPLAEEGRELDGSTLEEDPEEVPFSWTEYIMFAWLGMAMLWAWYVEPHSSLNPYSRDTQQ